VTVRTIDYKRVIDQNAPLMQVQQSTVDAFNGLITQNQILYGNFIKNIQLDGVTPVNVAHKLKRKFQGWIVTGINANENVWQTTTQALPEKFLQLQSSDVVTISIWVF